jgi:hypothetical protein
LYRVLNADVVIKGPAVMGAERKHCRVLTRAVVVKGCGRIPRFLQFLRRVTVGWLVDAALEMHLTGTYLIQDGADGRNLKVLAVEGPAHHCQFGGSEMVPVRGTGSNNGQGLEGLGTASQAKVKQWIAEVIQGGAPLVCHHDMAAMDGFNQIAAGDFNERFGHRNDLSGGVQQVV